MNNMFHWLIDDLIVGRREGLSFISVASVILDKEDFIQISKVVVVDVYNKENVIQHRH